MYAIIGIIRPNIRVVDLNTNEVDLCSIRLLRKLSFMKYIVGVGRGVEQGVIKVYKSDVIIDSLKSDYAVMGIDFPYDITFTSDKVRLEQCLNHDIVIAVIPYGVTVVNSQAFDNCSSMTTVRFPDSVYCIGESAFESNVLSALDLPRKIKYIENYAFAGSLYIESVVFPPTLERLGDSCFTRCLALKSVDLSKTDATLGVSAFASCTSLTEVLLPKTLEKLPKDCFYNCTHLSHIDLPDTLSEIYDSCFEKCLRLTEIDLPESVTVIRSRAFYNCDRLKRVCIPENVVSIAADAFGADTFYLTDEGVDDTYDFVVKCKEGSYADRYAQQHGYTVEYY